MEIKLFVQEDDTYVEKETSRPADSTVTGDVIIEGLMPGRYEVYAFSHGYPNYYSRSVPLEIVDKDLKRVDIKALPGATISAQTKVEGNSDPASLARLMETSISVEVEMLDQTEKPRFIGPWTLNPDGNLRIQGITTRKCPVYPLSSTQRPT